MNAPAFKIKKNLQPDDIRLFFEEAYQNYHNQFELKKDPVHFAHRYQDPRDQEVVAFISSLLAYGNVKAMLPAIETILSYLGPNPRGLTPHKQILSFRYRFTTGDDLVLVFDWLRDQLNSFETLEGALLQNSGPLKNRLAKWIQSFEGTYANSNRRPQLRHLLPNPDRGSSCKRLNLFLRWMVRPRDGIDLGLWSQIAKSELFLPIDTHLLKMIHRLEWSRSKTPNWRMVEEVTERLKKLCPEDPIRYDFSLCHLSMSASLR